MKRKAWLGLALGGLLLAGGLAVRRFKGDRFLPASVAAVAERPRVATPLEVAETVYDGKLGSGWDDWGWGPHDLGQGPAKVVFENFGGILLHHSELQGPFGALSFRFKAPSEWRDFLQVSLRWSGGADESFQTVQVEQRHIAELADGWHEVLIDWQELDPDRRPIDRVMISSRAGVGGDFVELEKIVLTKPATDRAAPPAQRRASLSVVCEGESHVISEAIYGGSGDDWSSGQSAQRMGGNPLSRANWDLGAWNVGKDWYFENTSIKQTMFEILSDKAKRQQRLAVVVPMIGWVAKDSQSVGFPRTKFPEQAQFDAYRPEAGNGLHPDGKKIGSGEPTLTSVPADPALIEQWVRKVVDADKVRGSRSVEMYILDNEPSLWSSTHRDVHPQPLSYDELLDRTIKYASAIRRADPGALIAGPAEWGWLGYEMSAVDSAAGADKKPDRLKHGDTQLVAWYLEKLAEHERVTGTRLLDVLDLHFYPAAEGVYDNARRDRPSGELRLRSVRALWDPTYVDESWIGQPIGLIPRMKRWVRERYPGRKLMLGEWSFGADDHISGGLAVAEALGRFGQQGLDYGFFWGPLKEDTPIYWAFRAFRNFDGAGGRFQDVSLTTRNDGKISLFASRDPGNSRLVLVLVNGESVSKVDVTITLSNCGRVTSTRMFSYAEQSKGLAPHEAKATADADGVTARMEPFSFAALDLGIQPD